MTGDWRVAKAASARAQAAEWLRHADNGGTVLLVPVDCERKAAECIEFAEWVEGKIAAFPHKVLA